MMEEMNSHGLSLNLHTLPCHIVSHVHEQKNINQKHISIIKLKIRCNNKLWVANFPTIGIYFYLLFIFWECMQKYCIYITPSLSSSLVHCLCAPNSLLNSWPLPLPHNTSKVSTDILGPYKSTAKCSSFQVPPVSNTYTLKCHILIPIYACV